MAEAAQNQNTFQYVLKNDPKEVEKYFSIENAELLSDIERMAGLDIMAEFAKKVLDLDAFMKKEYMTFNYKINKCLVNHCYSNIYSPREDVRKCVATCTGGIKNADNFVQEKVDLFTSSFATCLEEAQKPKKNVMQETFECYDTMLNTFDSLKREIKKEFNFYE